MGGTTVETVGALERQAIHAPKWCVLTPSKTAKNEPWLHFLHSRIPVQPKAQKNAAQPVLVAWLGIRLLVAGAL